MSQLKKEDIQQEVFDLYDDYAHSRITRRAFMEKLSRYAVGGVGAAALAGFLLPDYARAIQVEAGDKRLQTRTVTYSSPQGGGQISGQLSRPAQLADKTGGIIVVHENRGLNPYIADVGRRAALEGYITLAPDALSPLGGYPGNDDDGREMQAKRDRNEMLADFIAAYQYLQNHPDCNGKVGVVGFCFGGWVSNMMAARVPDLAAAVPYYGRQAPLEDVAAIRAPLMLHFAEHDEGVNAGWPDYEAALKANGKSYQAFHYPGTNHGFHNDSTPRYDEAAAKLSWQRTMAFFRQHLG